MYHEIRSERLSVKVNAARIRRAASWPGHGEWKSDRSKEMVRERVREREREREREAVRAKATQRGRWNGRWWEPNWSKLASLVISGVSGGGGGSTWLHFLGKEGRKEGVYTYHRLRDVWIRFSMYVRVSLTYVRIQVFVSTIVWEHAFVHVFAHMHMCIYICT